MHYWKKVDTQNRRVIHRLWSPATIKLKSALTLEWFDSRIKLDLKQVIVLIVQLHLKLNIPESLFSSCERNRLLDLPIIFGIEHHRLPLGHYKVELLLGQLMFGNKEIQHQTTMILPLFFCPILHFLSFLQVHFQFLFNLMNIWSFWQSFIFLI